MVYAKNICWHEVLTHFLRTFIHLYSTSYYYLGIINIMIKVSQILDVERTVMDKAIYHSFSRVKSGARSVSGQQ